MAVIALSAVLLRLPLLGSPLSRDEAGYLMVAAQLGPGSSLYGDHWVDRPPLLLLVFAAADRLGGADALRGLGLLLVVVAVAAAAGLGAAAGGRLGGRCAVLCAAVAAVLLTTPLFGTTEVNGELVAAPFVLGGAAQLLAAVRAGPVARPCLVAVAGASGAAAVLVKQNQWDVWVLLVALLLSGAWSRRSRPGVSVVLPFLGGAAVTTSAVLAVAAGLGTSPVALWDAVVVFRFEAAAVVADSAGPATAQRLVDLVVAFSLSGAPLLLVLLGVVLPRPPAPNALDLRLPAVAVLAWESVAVLGGASYWPPYLICTVTGLVLATAVVHNAGPGRGGVAAARRAGLVPLAWAVVASLVALSWAVVDPAARPQDEVVEWLRANAAPGDDAVVAYGSPDILHGAGLKSPYSHLWSLPVRVRDPDLVELGRLLNGPEAPDWVVLTGPSLATWGIDDSAGTEALTQGYTEAAEVGRFTVYSRDGAS